MPLNLFQPHVLLATFRTATLTKAYGGLGVGRWFARVVFGAVGLITRVPKKVTMTLSTTSGGFETSRVSFQEIGAGFLATGPAKVFSFVASMAIFVLIGFPTVGTHVTGPKKSWQMGDDIVMVFLVEQDQLFVLSVSKRGDMEGPVSVHQDNLVTDEGRGRTEGRQGVVAARTQGNVGFMMELQSQGSLQFSSLSNAVVFRMLVHSGFGDDEGPSTTDLIFILDADDRVGFPCYCFQEDMSWFSTAWLTPSLRRMMDLGDGQLKRIVHFKLFVAVERLGQPIEEGVQASASFTPFSRMQSPSLKLMGQTVET